MVGILKSRSQKKVDNQQLDKYQRHPKTYCKKIHQISSAFKFSLKLIIFITYCDFKYKQFQNSTILAWFLEWPKASWNTVGTIGSWTSGGLDIYGRVRTNSGGGQIEAAETKTRVWFHGKQMCACLFRFAVFALKLKLYIWIYSCICICIDTCMYACHGFNECVQNHHVGSNKIWFLCVLIIKHLDNANYIHNQHVLQNHHSKGSLLFWIPLG